MSRTIILTEDQYAVLMTAGAAHNQTPEGILAEWIEAVRLCNRALTPDVSRMYRLEWIERVDRVRSDADDDPNATQPSADQPVGAGASRRG
jgi:hypothetical protein